MISRNLSDYLKGCTNYTELRTQRNFNQSIAMLNGNIVRNSKDEKSGVSARVRCNGSWGFASATNMDEETIKAVIESANNNAKLLGSEISKNSEDFSVFEDSVKRDLSTKKTRATQSEVMGFLKEVDEYIQKKYTDLSSRTVGLSSLDMEKNLITSQGATAYTFTPRSLIYIVMNIEKDGEVTEVSGIVGGFGQFEDNFESTEKVFAKIEETYNHLKKKCDGVFAEAGLKDCILDADLAGILAHEAIGHTTEADLVLGGSVAGDYLNEKVASELITLVDYANTALGKQCPVPIYIDDEGVTAKDVTIIENGILKGFMHNRDSANHFGVEATGNGRAYQFNDEPLIRMRNTAILPGKSKLEDMIASIEDGYYLIKPSNGQADSTSEFMFGVTLGYEIKNGKLGRAIKDTTIAGVAFDVLKTITMVSDDMSWSAAGMCGKKQPIPVGMGGPAIKCKINIGGR
ncbi:TldD/PmbA family protein [Oceanirhabdus seepicola]|uniref:TldD/PmbA family protein n=1 Tax=Oceanirhabdus seepicola TaxID=2828781 RepID=A0A9J6NXG9_9CLOT|nr:TldD/PmbA family protein [Oceanirhabdus seepicola]MCM1988756.1 TldD/PmbA family protein [Oceanirhabdus seepicola]